MRLTDHEKAMLRRPARCRQSPCHGSVLRYGEAFGAERVVETTMVAGPRPSTPRGRSIAVRRTGLRQGLFRTQPRQRTRPSRSGMAVHLQSSPASTNDNWEVQGVDAGWAELQKSRSRYLGQRGVQLIATCTPYQVGNVPGEGRTLRLGWIVRRHLLQLGSPAAAHQCRGRIDRAPRAHGPHSLWATILPENRFGSI